MRDTRWRSGMMFRCAVDIEFGEILKTKEQTLAYF